MLVPASYYVQIGREVDRLIHESGNSVSECLETAIGTTPVPFPALNVEETDAERHVMLRQAAFASLNRPDEHTF